MLRRLLLILLIAAAGAAALFVLAGRSEGPAIEIREPQRFIGSKGTIDVAIQAPAGGLSAAEIAVEQGEVVLPLFTLGGDQGTLEQEAPERVRVRREYDRAALPGIQPGAARLVVRATRPVLYGWREVSTEVVRDVTVRFQPPRVTVLSTFHYINHGGSELVVYRLEPPDAASGVRVGDREFPGYPASGAGVAGAGPEIKVALFALLHDQDLAAPIEIYARDEAGNDAQVPFEHRVFPKQFRQSRIEIDERFLRRVVPPIHSRSEELRAIAGELDEGNLLEMFVAINGELRAKNAETLETLAARSAPRMLWEGPFLQLGGSQVESGFADYRTYFFQGREIDRQVHLGFDLAKTANVPVQAANHGRVVFADYLGIYGNTLVIDHGLGLQSLYAHLSSIGVGVGDEVTRGQEIGRSGMTGLAGGDHLHFTMLLQGRPVTPIEWWDPQWMRDRITRKLEAAKQVATS